MLELRQNCENCDKLLPTDSLDAMICTYECTFCEECVEKILHNVCPNCGGGFQQRPVRPKKQLGKYPPKTEKVFKPVDLESFEKMRNGLEKIPPENR